MARYNENVAIRNVQRYLRQLSYTDADIPPVPIDGIFGEATELSLIAFQTKNGLYPSGVADRESFDTLYEKYLISTKRFAPPKGFSPFARVPEQYALTVGDIGFAVSSVQFLLNEISIIQDGLGELAITGIYNIDTAHAVSVFQAGTDLDVTGEVNKETWNMLVDTYEHYAKDYVQ